QDTFTAQTWRGEHGVCLGVNSAQRCGYGYTIGDGWKLIFYPEHFPVWLLSLINTLWITGWTIGVGWWAAMGRRDTTAARSGGGEEIGRASCRERAKISGVAVPVTEKQRCEIGPIAWERWRRTRRRTV